MGHLVDSKKYEAFCEQACLAYGVSPEAARVTAKMLVRTDMLGVYTHGTYSLQAYLDKIPAGGTDAKATPEVIAEGMSWAIVDGHNAIATYNNYYGLEVAMEKARKTGVAYVGVKNSGHYGAPGIYAVEAAEHGLVAFVMSNTPKNMTAPGTRGETCGNNPLSYAVPCAGRHPVFMDIGLSAVNGTKIKRTVDSGVKELPVGWIVDDNGQPTTDASTKGYHMAPMAGHKGFCLSMFVEIMTAVLSGGTLADRTKLWRIEEAIAGTSHAIILFDPKQMLGADVFENRMKATSDDYLASPKAEGTASLMMPGDREWEHYEDAVKSGLDLPDDIYVQMVEMGKKHNLDFDSCLLK